jgi:hypothetical protein
MMTCNNWVKDSLFLPDETTSPKTQSRTIWIKYSGDEKPWFRRKFGQSEFETKLMSFGFHLDDPRPHVIAIDASFRQQLIYGLNVHSVNTPNV